MKLTTFMVLRDSEETIAVAISPYTVKLHIDQILQEYPGEKTVADFMEYLAETQGCEIQVLTNNVIEINIPTVTAEVKGRMINGEFIPKEVLEEVSPLDVSYYGQEEAIGRARKKVKDAIQE